MLLPAFSLNFRQQVMNEDKLKKIEKGYASNVDVDAKIEDRR